MKKKQILLYCPIVSKVDGAYGGGTGGYTRKVMLYMNYFKSEEFYFEPCYHTINGQIKPDWFVLRFIIDIFNFKKHIIFKRPKVVHILAQYRTAIFREFAIVLLSRIFRIPVLYELKAGVFVNWYNKTGGIQKKLINFCLKHSEIVLGQGMPYVDLVQSLYPKKKVFFHPNFVPSIDIKPEATPKLENETVKILFVGYAFRDKGVFEMVEACQIASESMKIELTFVGKEHEEFTAWLDAQKEHSNLKINRVGILPSEEVIAYYDSHDVYCYPTSHKGEGHNNSINEAMMGGMVIITTKIGFLGSILGDDRAYFLDEVTKETVANQLLYINHNRDEAVKKGLAARKHLMENFTSDIAFSKLESYYEQLTGKK